MLSIVLLGEVSVTDDAGTSRCLPRAQASVVFARLVLERTQGSRREDIADTVWEGDLPATWSSALRNVLSIVRSFTEELCEFVEGDPPLALSNEGGRYRLVVDHDIEVDVEQALNLASLASLYIDEGQYEAALTNAVACSELLAAPFLPSHGADWIREMRQTLETTRVRCLDIACEAALGVGDAHTAIRMANEAIRIRPHRESAYRCRMTAQAQLGNRAEALSTYQEVRRLLSEEIGVDPSPETEAAYIDLLGVIASAETITTGTSFPFSGRDRELDQITHAWEEAQKGQPCLIHISGEAGIGKTRLMLEAGKHFIQHGAVALFGSTSARCAHPFSALAIAIGNYLASLPDDALPRFNRATAQILDQLLSESEFPADGGHKRLGWIEIALADALTSISAGRSVVVMLDDLGMHGDQTMDLICRAIKRPGGASKILFIATTRPTTPVEPQSVQSLSTIGALRTIHLRGLEDAALSSILHHGPTRAQIRHQIRELGIRTGGNPFLIREVLAHPQMLASDAETLPVTIVQHVQRQLIMLGDQATKILRAASVLGAEFELALAATISGIDLQETFELSADLCRQGILQPSLQQSGSPTLRFVHGLVEDVVYDAIDAARREQLHQATADAVSDRATESLHWARIRAYHLERGSLFGERSDVVESLWHAAALASDHEAVNFCTRAMQLMPGSDTELRQRGTLRLGQALANAGLPAAHAPLASVAIEALGTNRLELAAEAIRSLHQISESAARSLIDIAAHRIAAGALSAELDLNGAIVLALHLETSPHCEDCVDGPAMADALRLLHQHMLSMSTIAEVESLLRSARWTLGLATRLHDRPRQAFALHEIAMAASTLGNHSVAGHALLRLGIDDDVLDDQLITLLPNSERLRAESSAARRLRLGSPAGGPTLAGDRGSESDETCHRIAAGLLSAATAAGQNMTDAIRALQHLVNGDQPNAVLHSQMALASLRDALTSPQDMYQAGLIALTATCLNDAALADRVYELLLPSADLTCCDGYRSYAGPASLHLGRLAILLEDWNAAESHLAKSSRTLAGSRATSWQAVALSSFADLLSLANCPHDSRWIPLLRSEAAHCELSGSF